MHLIVDSSRRSRRARLALTSTVTSTGSASLSIMSTCCATPLSVRTKTASPQPTTGPALPFTEDGHSHEVGARAEHLRRVLPRLRGVKGVTAERGGNCGHHDEPPCHRRISEWSWSMSAGQKRASASPWPATNQARGRRSAQSALLITAADSTR